MTANLKAAAVFETQIVVDAAYQFRRNAFVQNAGRCLRLRLKIHYTEKLERFRCGGGNLCPIVTTKAAITM